MSKKSAKSVVEQTGEVIIKDGLIEVSITKVPGVTERKIEKIKIRPFITDTANVSVSLGATIPTVNYANAKFNIFASVPCYIEEMVDVMRDLKVFVEKQAEHVASEIHAEVSGNGKEEQADFNDGEAKTDEIDIEEFL